MLHKRCWRRSSCGESKSGRAHADSAGRRRQMCLHADTPIGCTPPLVHAATGRHPQGRRGRHLTQPDACSSHAAGRVGPAAAPGRQQGQCERRRARPARLQVCCGRHGSSCTARAGQVVPRESRGVCVLVGVQGGGGGGGAAAPEAPGSGLRPSTRSKGAAAPTPKGGPARRLQTRAPTDRTAPTSHRSLARAWRPTSRRRRSCSGQRRRWATPRRTARWGCATPWGCKTPPACADPAFSALSR